MYSLLNPILCFALVFSFINISNTLSFCEVFAKNGYRISYGFRRITREDPFLNYIFINHSYWRLQYTDSSNDQDKRVVLLAEDGKRSNGFGGDFSMAFCTWFGESCKLGLLGSDKKLIHWYDMDGSTDELKVVGRGSPILQIDLQLKNVRTAFVPNWGQFKYNILVFLRQRPKIDYQFYQINSDLTASHQNDPASWLGAKYLKSTDPLALLSLVPGLEVIAVMAQYSGADERENRGFGMIVLFQFDRSIKYCYTYTRELSGECTRKPKTLIDCSKTVVTTNTTTTTQKTTVEEESNMLSKLLVALVVISFATIIFGLWMYRTNCWPFNQYFFQKDPKAKNSSLWKRSKLNTTSSTIKS